MLQGVYNGVVAYMHVSIEEHPRQKHLHDPAVALCLICSKRLVFAYASQA